MDPNDAFYFGTYQGAGHYLRDLHWNSRRYDRNGDGGWDAPFPWSNIDGGLTPPRGREGEAALHHKDGWTALAFVNYTDDNRGGSNSVFFFKGTLTFEEAVAATRALFPHVVERFAFEIVPAQADAA